MEDIKNNYYSSDDEATQYKQKFKKPYRVTALTKVGWGKLKGKPHSEFLKKENRKYSQWVINQGDDFRYSNTRNWIIQNLEKQCTENLDAIGATPIKDLTLEQIENWTNFGMR